MNAELVIEELVRQGYHRVRQPLHVADLDFNFDGVLTGPNDQENLTLILEDKGKTLLAAQRRLGAFAVVLERTGSTRPMNVVLIGKSPDAQALFRMQDLARVIVVQPGDNIQEALRPLFKLDLPMPIEPSISAKGALLKELGGISDTVTERLVNAADVSADEVKTTLYSIINEAVAIHP